MRCPETGPSRHPSDMSSTITPRRAALARILPFALYILFLIIAAPLADVLGVDPRWMYALQITCVIAALAVFSREYIELRPAAPAAQPPDRRRVVRTARVPHGARRAARRSGCRGGDGCRTRR